MATYNWSIVPGIPNRYGFGVAPSADDVRPSNCAYVSIFGNDDFGNGSRKKPFRSQSKALSVSEVIILGAGAFRENINYNGSRCLSDGDVFLDQSFVGNGLFLGIFGARFISGSTGDLLLGSASGNNAGDYSWFTINNSARLGVSHFRCVFDGRGSAVANASTEEYSLSIGNNTFVGLDLTFTGAKIYAIATNSIFYNCKITLNGAIFDYSLFFGCEFRKDSGSPYVAIVDLETLLDYISTNFPTNPGFTNCSFGDPLFNNQSIGDYSLSMGSPAKNRSYLGTFAGAYSIAYRIKSSETDAESSFDADTAVNINIGNDSITMADSSLVSSIKTKVFPNILGRELGNAPIFGFNADRNGQYIDSIADLSAAQVFPGTDLSPDTPYLVGGGAIIWNGHIIQPGERFTTGSDLSFDSDFGGFCVEIVEAPQRHTIMARFSDGGSPVALGDPLVAGNWYFVEGTVSYNGTDYTDQCFKATDTDPFTGTGLVIEAMSDEDFQHYETGKKFSSNNAGDVRTGEIIRGNGDPSYERGTGKEFPINARFIQLYYIIQPNNLKP